LVIEIENWRIPTFRLTSWSFPTYVHGIGEKSMPSEPVTLASLLAQSQDKRPIPEAQVATLIEACERYRSPCPFKVGDIVTPRVGLGYSDGGLPHVILEVADEPHRHFAPTEGASIYASAFGSRLDVRVANFVKSGEIVAFWQESWRLEPWTGEDRP
jgi:hypothetical protein